jgi:hypothetical protein
MTKIFQEFPRAVLGRFETKVSLLRATSCKSLLYVFLITNQKIIGQLYNVCTGESCKVDTSSTSSLVSETL